MSEGTGMRMRRVGSVVRPPRPWGRHVGDVSVEAPLLGTGAMPADQSQAELDALDAEVKAAIAACNGDPRKATMALRAANAYLEERIEQILARASAGDTKHPPRKGQ